MKPRNIFILGLFVLLVSCGQAPQTVSVDQAWVRATKPGQEVAAAYMTLTSKQDAELFKVESDVIGNVEIHSMTMDNGVMEMRMLDTLALEKNKPYKLEPGGFHLMLFDLKKPLAAGDHVKFKLYFKDTAGKVETVDISSPVREGEPE
jgi:periplasmic copper chaperone A